MADEIRKLAMKISRATHSYQFKDGADIIEPILRESGMLTVDQAVAAFDKVAQPTLDGWIHAADVRRMFLEEIGAK